jgi:hypothetical protein
MLLMHVEVMGGVRLGGIVVKEVHTIKLRPVNKVALVLGFLSVLVSCTSFHSINCSTFISHPIILCYIVLILTASLGK